jgi:hypothetical protein
MVLSVIYFLCYIVENKLPSTEVEKGISTVIHGDALVVRAAHVPQNGSPTFTFFELSTGHSPMTGSL